MEAARSANDRKGRLKVVGLLAGLVHEAAKALASVAKGIEARDVVVVALAVLTTAPELLIAAGVSATAIAVLTRLAVVLVRIFPERRAGQL